MSNRSLGQFYGCRKRMNILFGMPYLKCVIDLGKPDECNIAMRLVESGKDKRDCSEWRPLVFNK
jgi:hypothetical protein